MSVRNDATAPGQCAGQPGPVLKAFQFVEGRPSHLSPSSNPQKENERPHDAENIRIASDAKPLEYDPDQPQPFPSTPAPRLPLVDLIGNTDEPDRTSTSVHLPPQDQILWHAPSPSKNFEAKTPASKGIKRARSSSPPSSQKRASKPSRKSPVVDPAADIWNRYAISTYGDATKESLFAQIPFPSSPRVIEEAASNVSGLRRWTSCGIEWPSSKAKRRKVEPNPIKHEIESAMAGEPEPANDEAVAAARKAKISSLIERIQGSLARPREVNEEKGPSSSSPLPQRNESIAKRSDASISPTRQGRRVDSEDVLGDDKTNGPVNESQQEKAAAMMQPSSSDFGSDDMDMVALEKVAPVPVHAVVTSISDHTSTSADLNTKETATKGLLESNHACGKGDDGFDDDLDISAIDLAAIDSLEGQTATRELEMIKRVTAETPQYGVNRAQVDEFGDDDVDEESFMVAEIAATQFMHPGSLSGSNSNFPSTIQRYLINNVSEGVFTAKNNLQLPEKILLVEDEKTKLFKRIILRQSWFETRCIKGSYVHVIGKFTKGGECVIDDTQNMLILHPDHLVSTTVIADSFSCTRRAVLQDRVKATGQSSPPQLYGTLLHEIFQEAIKENCWDTEWLTKLIETLVSRHIEGLYEVKLSVPQAVDYLVAKMPELQAWARIFISAEPQAEALVQDRNSKNTTMAIRKLLDVEEHVWSPMYGMKGNIDATVQVAMRDDSGDRTLTVPFEVKTGKNNKNTGHRAQTALYTLLLSDRYDIPIEYGILYYLETSEISRIPAVRHEIRHMVMQRNELACYVRERLSLPPMLQNPHTCSRCYAKSPCFLYHKLVENGDGNSSGLKEKFDEIVQHLTPVHQEFFRKWDDLLTKEETEMMKFRRELWTMQSVEREKLGRCFANVILEQESAFEERSGAKINRFRYTFRKLNETGKFSFNESQIAVGEPIVVSDENGHYALAKGYVTSLQKRHVTVAVDRKLHNARIRRSGFDADTNQNFNGIMEVELSQRQLERSQSQGNPTPLLYRLDKDEFSSGLAVVRNNLVQIMSNEGFQSRELRGLVVDNVEPRFESGVQEYKPSGPQSQLSINEDQKAAIKKILSAKDYALVLGMPGTGKTTTIAHIIRALVAKGKSVLLTSYTHTAVDNILLKIRHDKVGILRIGALTKIHHDVKEFAILAAEPKTSIEQLQREYHEPQVVATTCLGINHPVFNERVFDYCIVDEASQITLPVCLGPIRMAKRFVLVGDHYQLPPLVQNRQAQQGGLDISLFKLLSDNHPSAVVELRHQYRMNAPIMSLSNTLIYSGRLKCGSEEVANVRLSLPNIQALSQLHYSASSCSEKACPSYEDVTCWLNLSIGPASAPVVFLDTDTLLPATREVARGPRITNILEAKLVTNLAHALLATGLKAESLGIITLYRSQLALIKSLLQTKVTPSQTELLEAHTADRFQGRDKEVVLISCVRSNENNVVGELLKDWRRVNVAMTRAKKKLIIIGSKTTLARGDELLQKLVALCEEENWIIPLPANAADDEAHCMPSFASGSAEVSHTLKLCSPTKALARSQAPKGDDDENGSQEYNAGAGRQSFSGRAPLGARTGNNAASSAVQKPFKQPAKVGRVTAKAVLGLGSETLKAKRPVLADLVNDILGEGAALDE